MIRRRLFLLAIVFCFLGLYSLEVSHHHVKDADEMACAICHVAAHSAADTPAPLVVPVFSLILFFLIPFGEVTHVFRRALQRARSRSPPAFSFKD